MATPTPLQAFSGVPKAPAAEKQSIVDGEKMTGAQALVRSLEDLGVKDVFGHSGPAWELLEQFGLRSDAIIAAVKELV